MYKVFANDVCIYNDNYIDETTAIINPKLTMEDNSSGSFEFSVPPTHFFKDSMNSFETIITIYKYDEYLWEGRVLEEEKDFFNNKKIYCEGELSYLTDTIQEPAEYHNVTVRGFLETILNIHNSKVDNSKKFYVGIVTVTDANDSLYRYTNYETTLSCLYDKLISSLGGHLRIRHEDGKRYLDYLADYIDTNSQSINFGENLLDFISKKSMSDYATAILPLGAMLDQSPISALYAYTTVKSVNNDSPYVVNDSAVSSRGFICKVVNWPEVSVPSILLRKAENYLNDIQYSNIEIECTAFDLRKLNADISSMKLLDLIHVYSKPHGLDRYFPIKKMVFDLANPEQEEIVLGSNISSSMSSASVDINTDLLNKIDELPKASDLLEQAQDNASQLINNATNGYISIIKNSDGTQELIIANNIDYTKATKVWRFNINGLGYSNNGYSGPYELAMTMDGQIVADVITTGILRGGNSWWNLSTGEMHLETVEELEETVSSSLANITYFYGYGTSETVHPDASAFTYSEMPTKVDGKYIWRLSIFSKNDGTSNYKYEMIQGLDGTNNYTYIRYSANSDGSNMTTSPQSDTEYIGFCTTTANQAPSTPSSYNWTLIKGEDGQEGSSIWTTTTAPLTVENRYLFYITNLEGPTGVTPKIGDVILYDTYRYTISSLSANNSVTSNSRQSLKGDPGQSVEVSSILYALSTSSTQIPEGDWSSTIPEIVPGTFLWSKTTFTDGKVLYTLAKQGSDGVGVTEVDEIHYANELVENPITITDKKEVIIYDYDPSRTDSLVHYGSNCSVKLTSHTPSSSTFKLIQNGRNLLDFDALIKSSGGYIGSVHYDHLLEIDLDENLPYCASSNYSIENGNEKIIYIDGSSDDNTIYNGKTYFSLGFNKMKVGILNRTGYQDLVNGTYYVQVEIGSSPTYYEAYNEIEHELEDNVATEISLSSGNNIFKIDSSISSYSLNMITYIPSKPSIPEERVTSSTNSKDKWSLIEPEYQSNLVYWKSLQTVYSDSNIEWTDPIMNTGLTSSFENMGKLASTIMKVQSNTNSEVEVLKDQITSVVSRTTVIEESYITDEGLEDVISNIEAEIESMLTQTESEITAQFTQYVRRDDENYQNLVTNITFNIEGVNISSQQIETNLQLTPDGVYIRDAQNEDIATMTSNQFTTGKWVLQQNDYVFNVFKSHKN